MSRALSPSFARCGPRRQKSANAGGTLCIAAARQALSSNRNNIPKLASQIRTAFFSIALNTGSSSPGEREMTCSTSAVAVCCSSASASFFSSSVLDARRRST